MSKVGLAVCVAALLFASSCSKGAVTQDSREGTALVDSGPQASGVVGLGQAQVGDDVMLALPAFDNGSKSELTVKSVRLKEVANGLRVIDYRTLAYSDTRGMLLAWDNRTSSAEDVSVLSDSKSGVSGLVVKARSLPKRYALVHLKIEAKPVGETKDVEVVYEQNGQTYHQTMIGEWEIDMAGQTTS